MRPFGCHYMFEDAVAFLADVGDAGRWVLAGESWGQVEWVDLERHAFFV